MESATNRECPVEKFQIRKSLHHPNQTNGLQIKQMV